MVAREPSAAPVVLSEVATHECVYFTVYPWGEEEPRCPAEWPDTPWTWCGACLAKAVTSDAA